MYRLKYEEISLGNAISEVTILFSRYDEVISYINAYHNNWLSWKVEYKERANAPR